MDNWKELVNPCVEDGKNVGIEQFNIKYEELEEIGQEVQDIQREFKQGDRTIAELTAGLLSIARTHKEELYLMQIAGAQIYATMREQPYRFK